MGKKTYKEIEHHDDGKNPMELAQGYVWGSNEESKREAAGIYLIHAIAEKYHGKALVDFDSHSIKIDVPDDQKTACLAEIEARTGIDLH